MTRPLIVELVGSFGASHQLALTRLKALEDRYRRVVERDGAHSPVAQRLKKRVESERRAIQALGPRASRSEKRLRQAMQPPRAPPVGEHPDTVTESEVAAKVQELMADVGPRAPAPAPAEPKIEPEGSPEVKPPPARETGSHPEESAARKKSGKKSKS